MTNSQAIKPKGFQESIAPFAFQHYARDFYGAYRAHVSDAPFSPARLFLLGRSIELAAKALHLGQGKAAKDLMNIGHDLEVACEPSMLLAYGLIVEPFELVELRKANEYYANKGFEYFLFKVKGLTVDSSGPQRALEGWPDLPNEELLVGLLNKLLIPKL